MPLTDVERLVRRIDALSEADLLLLHREVCRRAAAIYEPMYREKRMANLPTGVAAGQAKRWRNR